MTLLARIEEANNGSTELLVQFIVCGTVVGHVLPETARILLDTSDVFVKRTAALHLRPDLDRSDLTEERTEAVGEVMSKLRAEGLITGWRDELLAITPRFHRRRCSCSNARQFPCSARVHTVFTSMVFVAMVTTSVCGLVDAQLISRPSPVNWTRWSLVDSLQD